MTDPAPSSDAFLNNLKRQFKFLGEYWIFFFLIITTVVAYYQRDGAAKADVAAIRTDIAVMKATMTTKEDLKPLEIKLAQIQASNLVLGQRLTEPEDLEGKK